jgi:hypothetical protein
MESLKRIIYKFYSRKHTTISVRLDTPTIIMMEELKSNYGLNSSSLIRLSIWFMAILLDPTVTLKQILTQDAIDKLKKGEDVVVLDALKSIGKVLEDRVSKYYKSYMEL